MEKQCEICNKKYASIYSLSNHKRLYHQDKIDNKKMKNKEDNLYYCRYCDDKKYKNRNSRAVHELKCKISTNNNIIENIQQHNIIRLEHDKLKDKLINLKNKLVKKSQLTTKTFKSINKVLINMNNTIKQTLQIYNLGMENITEVIKEKDKIDILNSGYRSFDKLIQIVHCGQYNQFKNIIITNLKGDVAYVYDSDKGYFVTMQMNYVLEDIFRYRIYNLEEIYEEMKDGNKITEKIKKTIKIFIEKCECEEPYDDNNGKIYKNFKEYIKFYMKINLHNSSEQVKNDIAKLIEQH